MQPVSADIDHLSGRRVLPSVEDHADDLIDRADGGEEEQCCDKPFQPTHDDHHLS